MAMMTWGFLPIFVAVPKPMLSWMPPRCVLIYFPANENRRGIVAIPVISVINAVENSAVPVVAYELV